MSRRLANLCMRRLGWKMLGLEQSLGTRIVTDADELDQLQAQRVRREN